MKRLYVLLASLTLVSCTGGGETVVSGFGNSGNYFGVDAEADILAGQFASFAGTPQVTDQELLAMFDAIRENALAGDPGAAIVMYKVAARQRAPEDG